MFAICALSCRIVSVVLLGSGVYRPTIKSIKTGLIKENVVSKSSEIYLQNISILIITSAKKQSYGN